MSYPQFSLEFFDLLDTRVRVVTVKRPGKPPFTYEVNLDDISMYSDPVRAIYGIARRKIEEREAVEKQGRLLLGIPDRRHEARNFG